MKVSFIIIIIHRPIPMIFAYSDRPTMAHGPCQRGTAVIEFYTCFNATSYTKNIASMWTTPYGAGAEENRALPIPRRRWRSVYFIIIHAIIMISSWLIFVPIGIILATNYDTVKVFDQTNRPEPSKTKSSNLKSLAIDAGSSTTTTGTTPALVVQKINWLKWHKILMMFGFSETFTIAGASLVTGSGRFETTHGVLGASISLLLLVAIFTGILAERYLGKRVTRAIHNVFGYSIAILGIVNCFYGLQLALAGKYKRLIAAWTIVAIWVAVLLVIFFFKSVTTQIYNSLLFGRTAVQRAESFTAYTAATINVKWPKFTKGQFLEQVQKGEKWFLLGNYIVSVHGFKHPGGDVFLPYIGSDISQFFRPSKSGKGL